MPDIYVLYMQMSCNLFYVINVYLNLIITLINNQTGNSLKQCHFICSTRVAVTDSVKLLSLMFGHLIYSFIKNKTRDNYNH